VRETGEEGYILSPSFELLANPDFAASLASWYVSYEPFLSLPWLMTRSAEFLNPAYLALPKFLASTNYENPTDPTNTAVQHAFQAKGKSLIGILTDNPKAGRGFGTLMSIWGEGNSLIQDLYPIKEKLSPGFNMSKESVMWVDVGGGYGQKTIALKKAAPELPGRFIVQDMPATIENAPKHGGIEYQSHDFFTEQPIKGETHFQSSMAK